MSKLLDLARAGYEFEKSAADSTGKKVARVVGATAGVGVGGVVGSHIGAAAGIHLGAKLPVKGGFKAQLVGKVGNIVAGGVFGGVAGAGTGAVTGGMLGHKAVKSLQKEALFSPITPTAKGTGTVIENGSTMSVKTPLATRPAGGLASGAEKSVAKGGMSKGLKMGLIGGAAALTAGALLHKKKTDGQTKQAGLVGDAIGAVGKFAASHPGVTKAVAGGTAAGVSGAVANKALSGSQTKQAADYNWKDAAKSTAITGAGAAAGYVIGSRVGAPNWGAAGGASAAYSHLAKGMHSNGKRVRTHTEAETYTAPAAVARAGGIALGATIGGAMGKHIGYEVAPAFSKSRMPGPLKKARSVGYVAGAAIGALSGGLVANKEMNQHVKKAEEHKYTAGTALGSIGGYMAGSAVGHSIGNSFGHSTAGHIASAVGAVAGYAGAKALQHTRTAKELDTTSGHFARGLGHVSGALSGAGLGTMVARGVGHGGGLGLTAGLVAGGVGGYHASKAIQDHANHIKSAAEAALKKEEAKSKEPEVKSNPGEEGVKAKSSLIASAKAEMSKAASKV